MLFSDYRFTLDLHKTQSQISIPVTLGDTARKLYISFSVRGVPYVIKDGCRAVFSAKKADGTTLFNDCIIEDNMTVRYDFTANTATAEGITDCRILLYGANGRLLATPRFIMVVDKKVVYDDEIAVSDSERISIDNMMLAETARVNAEAERVASEMARTTAENDRVSAESVRAEAESQRLSEEKDRQTSEKERIAAETARVSTEKTRVDNETTRVSAENQRNSNEQTRTASETGRIDAEKKRVSAEDLRIESETTRVQSEALRKSAEILRNQNESKRESNETERISAEAERVSAEKDRATSEENRKTAERERVTAESARTKAEEARLSAEKERVSAETARRSAETVRSDNENIRIENENARIANETARKTNETARVNNENTRKTNETSRIEAENARISAETVRESAEARRREQSIAFTENEMERVQNETARKAEFDTWSSEVGKISAFDKRISNIEAAVMPELVTPTVDKTMAYSKDVPENVLPFASINEIGGMSYKCNNLIPFPYEKDGVDGGDAKLVVGSDGGITGSGTPTSAISFALSYKIELQEGTYTLSAQGTFANILVQIDVYNANGEVTSSRSIKDSLVFTAEKNGYVMLLVKRGANGEAMSGTCYPMLNEGETALPYEPYFTGLRDAKVTAIESVGANLIPFPYTDKSKTVNGITFVVNDDGSVTANGTSTSYAKFLLYNSEKVDLKLLNGTTYSFDHLFGNDTRFYVYIYYIDSAGTNQWATKRILWKDEYTLKQIYIQCPEGETANNATFYPMLNKGETILPYKPYTKNTIETPEVVQAIDGNGRGVNEQYHNKIVWNPAEGVKKFVKMTNREVFDGTEEWVKASYTGENTFFYIKLKNESLYSQDYLATHFRNISVGSTDTNIGTFLTKDSHLRFRPDLSIIPDVASWKAHLAKQYANGTPVTVEYILAEPIETDISDYLGDDNFIGVEAGGTVTAVNEHEYDVPFEVEYMVKGGGTGE